MKNTSFPAILLSALIMLSACGELKKSERKPFDINKYALTVAGQLLSPEEFAQACASKTGQMLNNGQICIFESYRNQLSAGKAYMDSTSDYELTDLSPGAAVLAVGEVTNNAVQILLNGRPISAVPSPAGRPITTNGGKLAYRFQPGNIEGVRVYAFTCVDNRLNSVRCPY